ncbi:MAG: DUF2851 family protein [Bacteroidetes bacterium]|nr:DUF2851 family protein [Bacteroidota bacterium]
MKESFLHFIWQFQYFNKKDIRTGQGEVVHVLSPGILNTDAGPDFQNARIKIGEIEWFGNVEIHVRSSDWINHKHQNDNAYDNVILHVVWEDDRPVKRSPPLTPPPAGGGRTSHPLSPPGGKSDGKVSPPAGGGDLEGADNFLPTIVLSDRISEKLLNRYTSLDKSKEKIPCTWHFAKVNRLTKLSMLDKALMQRLEEKAVQIRDILIRNNYDWEETTYQIIAKNFGFNKNSDSFFRLCRGLPLKILQKHRDNLLQIEALLFGQSGLLDESLKDDYPKLLNREYNFLSQKYSLKSNKLSKSEWKFLRLRPANFPTIRIAQFACMIYNTPHIFSKIINTTDIKQLYKLFEIKQSDYWQMHYLFDKETTHTNIPGFGKMSAENLIINTIAPLLVCYAKEKDKDVYIERAVKFLESLPAEKNFIINYWQDVSLPMKSAFDTQAGIELYNNFCKPKKCLSCKIGVAIMNQ